MIGPLVSEIVILKLGIFVADYSSIGKINMGTKDYSSIGKINMGTRHTQRERHTEIEK